MLPSPLRMRRSAEFIEAFRRGRRSGAPNLAAHLVRRSGSVEPPLVGFVVSRAVGGSVVRNRVKRRLRHLVADRRAVLPAGSLLVVRANPRSADASYRELAGDLDRVLQQVLRRGGRRTGVG